MILDKEEVEKAAKKYSIKEYGEPLDWIDTHLTEKQFDYNIQQAFIAGEKLAEEKVQEYIGDIITENQGLKLYKDNEAERFKGIALEFVRWIVKNKYDGCTPLEEKFDKFLKERNEKEIKI